MLKILRLGLYPDGSIGIKLAPYLSAELKAECKTASEIVVYYGSPIEGAAVPEGRWYWGYPDFAKDPKEVPEKFKKEVFAGINDMMGTYLGIAVKLGVTLGVTEGVAN